MKNSDQSTSKNPLNGIENIVLLPIKKTKMLSVILCGISLIITLFYSFSAESTFAGLKDLSGFLMNIILVIAAFSIAIFALPISNLQNDKNTLERNKEIVIRYVGEVLLLLSIVALGYSISVFGSGNMPTYIAKLYSVAMMVVFIRSITKFAATIVMFFNIKE